MNDFSAKQTWRLQDTVDWFNRPDEEFVSNVNKIVAKVVRDLVAHGADNAFIVRTIGALQEVLYSEELF